MSQNTVANSSRPISVSALTHEQRQQLKGREINVVGGEYKGRLGKVLEVHRNFNSLVLSIGEGGGRHISTEDLSVNFPLE